MCTYIHKIKYYINSPCNLPNPPFFLADNRIVNCSILVLLFLGQYLEGLGINYKNAPGTKNCYDLCYSKLLAFIF